MPWWIPRPAWAIFLGGWAACACFAQPSPSLREAVDAAWALSPQARTLVSRQAELDARADAAASFFAGPASVSASYRSDQIGSGPGVRESELGLSAPLWDPALRRAVTRQVELERADLALQQATARARLAAEVREAAADATLAQIEQEQARAKVREAQALAADVERRVRAGESARVDLLQAQSVLRQAQGAESLAGGSVARAAAQWRALTGLPQLPTLDEGLGPAQEAPTVAAARSRLQAAQARLEVARAERRDPVEVGVGMMRERAAAGAPTDTSVKFSVRVPLGAGPRNTARIAAAQAEVDVAQAEADAAERAARAAIEAAGAGLDAARRVEALAAERERSAREVQALIARSYQLGESDLPTRLRAETERFEAELAHARARLETRRATARLNQASGVMP